MSGIVYFLYHIAAAIGLFVMGIGSISVIVSWIFKFLTEKWLNAKFEERLADYKHAKQKELEDLKFRINSLMDRRLKLHEREFGTLPDAWAKLVDAYNLTAVAVSGFQMYADVNQMGSEQFDSFITSSGLDEWQIAEVRAADDRNKKYIEFVDWQRMVKAQGASGEVSTFLTKNGIFIQEPMKTKFQQIVKIISDALTEHRINFDARSFPGQRLTKYLDLFAKEGDILIRQIEIEIQGRLWDAFSVGKHLETE
jgi:hypothetical protein